MKSTVLRGPYLDDLLEQPAAVDATIRGLVPDALLTAICRDPHRYDRIVLTGMGSSLAALQPLAIRLVEQGLSAMIVDASELLHAQRGLLGERTLVVAASQSGKSVEIAKLVAPATRRGAALVGITNTPGSPLAAGADAVVFTQAGHESTVSCKTYVATLVALSFLGDALLAPASRSELPDLASASASMRSYLDRWEAHVDELVPLVDGIRDVFFAGRGTSLAAAYTAGLIVKESARFHAEGMTSAALRHGPMEMASDHVLALVYEGDAAVAPLNRTLVDDLGRAGARAHLVGAVGDIAAFRLPEVPASQRPLVEILPAQMLSLALAAHAGIEAGRFLHATKVTVTE